MKPAGMLVVAVVLAFGCKQKEKEPTLAERAAADDAKLVAAAKARLDRGEPVSASDAMFVWMACGKHPVLQCSEVMMRSPDPLVTSWDVYYQDQLRTVYVDQTAGKPIEPWRLTLLRTVCSRKVPSLHSLCSMAKLE
jgi:hypothetical protein